MLNVAVIGANGFIGRHLTRHLSKKYKVIPVYKSTVNLFNRDNVFSFLNENDIDVIINTVSYGGNELVNSNDLELAMKNLEMFTNLYEMQDMYEHYLNIGSGSEFDVERRIDSMLESEIFERMPRTSYAASKNIISRLIYCKEKFTNLRLFGCFGPGEKDFRFLSKFYDTRLCDNFVIEYDRYFDYFSIQDFCLVVDHVINERLTAFDINCVYENKMKLSEILKCFCENQSISFFATIKQEIDKPYTGSNIQLKNSGAYIEGLEKGLAKWSKSFM